MAGLEVQGQADVVGHFVDARIVGHQKRIGEMKVADAGADVPSVIQAKLHADALLQGEVLVGSVFGQCLLVESDHAGLDEVIGLPPLAIAPDHAQADGRNAEACNGLVGCAQWIAEDVCFGWLAQDDNGKNLGDVIHIRSDEPAPGMAIVLNACEVEIAPPRVREDVKVTEGVQGFIDQLAFNRRLIALDGRVGKAAGMRETWGPDEAGGEAREICGKARNAVGHRIRSALDQGKIRVLHVSFHADGEMAADGCIHAATEQNGKGCGTARGSCGAPVAI